jgi:thiamine kinase-like enzyme
MTDPRQIVATLACWTGPVDPQPLGGGITNKNFVVEDAGRKYVVRIGADIPVHQIMRFNEVAASRAAHEAGVSPRVVFAAPGALVIDYIEGRTFGESDVTAQDNLERILPVIARAHRDIPKHLRGAALVFWVFHVLRDYVGTLKDGDSRHLAQLPALWSIAGQLESAVGRIELVYAHNDLLPGNFIDDGQRIWLIDWDYAGFNSPLFDLGGLASNNGLSPEQEIWLLESYFERAVTDDLLIRYHAMKCASLLRESMWSMVQEIHSTLDFDYAAYTAENMRRFEGAWKSFQAM